jgi:hypothetical protein
VTVACTVTSAKSLGPRVEQQRQLAVVDRHLGQHRGQRPVPERLADALVRDLAPHVWRTQVVGAPAGVAGTDVW